jgi:membrane associated rhomboid family serine protease
MREQMGGMGLPRPGKALLAVMGTLLGIWVLFAIALNYGGADQNWFVAFTGNTTAILHGEVWRLFTAGLLHSPGSVSHILYALLGLYFLGPTLESRWGTRRTLLFLAGSSVLGFASQMAAEVLLPGSLGAAFGQPFWFGSMGMVEAIAVAWALSNRGQTVRLMFVLPVTGNGLLVFVIGVSVLMVIAGQKPSEGMMTPFGGMLAGYLFGGGSPSPARRAWLRLRYLWIARRASKYRATQPRLRVIEGGESSPPSAAPPRRPPTDKRFLN